MLVYQIKSGIKLGPQILVLQRAVPTKMDSLTPWRSACSVSRFTYQR
jgi:hypothetical protein